MALDDDVTGGASTTGSWYVATSCSTATTITIAAMYTALPTNGSWIYYNNSFSSSGAGHEYPVFDPAAVEGLRKDYHAVAHDRGRQRAEIRGRKLFIRTVGPEAYALFKKRGYHDIIGASGARYRLAPGRWVKVMAKAVGNGDEVEHELCAHLELGIPWFDTMAVQHLMLTASLETELQFQKAANRHETGIYPIPEMREAA